jgi:hypothetical protein
MNAKEREKEFLKKVEGFLNEGMENLDNQTAQRLEHIRMNALRTAAEEPPGFFTPLRWVMVAGFATATMAVVALFFWLNTSSGNLPIRYLEDFEIITSQERIDFYQNLDFYRWLATKENREADGKSS